MNRDQGNTISEQILAAVAADADVLSISETTISHAPTVGLGTLSGRAIMAVGEYAIRGAELR